MECYLQKLLSGEELSDEERAGIVEAAKEAGYPMIRMCSVTLSSIHLRTNLLLPANLEIPWEGTDDIDFENRGFPDFYKN